MEMVFHFGTSLAQNSIESTTSRIDGAGGKMNSFCAMNSFRMSFCSVPPSCAAGTPCFSATAMYIQRRIAAGEVEVIHPVEFSKGVPPERGSIFFAESVLAAPVAI